MQDSLLEIAPLLDDLLPNALSEQVKAAAKRVTFSHGQLIQTRGDTKSGLCIVRAGAVRVGNQGRDGSYLTTSILTPGQCYGEFTLLAGLPRTHEMVAIGDTKIDEISKRRFLKLYDTEPELAKALLRISLVRNHSLLEFMDDMRRLPLLVHVAKFVYRAAAGKTAINIRQEDLAFTFGVSRVSMGKVLKRLAALDLLRLGYGKIELAPRQRFQNWLAEQSLIEPLAPVLDA
ncbi:MAG: Crp/Fnr family transcriptional regulator [Pseudomonadales bacterium]